MSSREKPRLAFAMAIVEFTITGILWRSSTATDLYLTRELLEEKIRNKMRRSFWTRAIRSPISVSLFCWFHRP